MARARRRCRGSPGVVADVRQGEARVLTEPAAAGVKIGGRSLHSARELLNGSEGRAAVADQQGSLADQLRRLVADFEREASREVERLRAAMAEAVQLLREALAQ